MNASASQTLPRPLAGVTVLDLTTALAGPFATFLLAGLGARVIKIENPLSPDTCRNNAPYIGKDGPRLAREQDDDISVSAINRLRNKQAITLNLKLPEARKIFADLVAKADIVIDNFSRGTLEKLGVGYSFGSQINPRIIYCSITGFGSDGEPGGGKAMDAIIQALSGVMMTSGAEGDPPMRVGVPFADLCAPVFGIVGVLAALHQARTTGKGQFVDVSMLGVMTSMAACEPFDLLERCGVPQRTGQTVPRLAPFGIFQASDGFVAICAPTEAFAAGLFKAMDRPELCADPRFHNRDARVVNVNELNRMITDFTQKLTTAELVVKLDANGVPAAPVRKPAEAFADPRVVARGETVRLEHPKFGEVEEIYGMGLPIRFSGATVGFDQPPPAIGEHNHTIYGELLGYSEEKLRALADGKII